MFQNFDGDLMVLMLRIFMLSHDIKSGCFPIALYIVRLSFTYSLMFVGHSYSEVSNNCFDFVLQFLQLLLHTFGTSIQDPNHPLTWDTITNKEKFCVALILPQTKRAARYIAIYRRLLHEEFVVDASDRCGERDSTWQLVNMESCTTRL